MKRLIWATFFLLIISCNVNKKVERQDDAATEKIPVIQANNRDYFPVLHDLLDNAQESIKVMVFQARYYLAFPGSSTNVAFLDLVQAVERGVDVTLVLDSSGWNKETSELTRLVGELLKEKGVKVFYDDPNKTTHDKVVLVDGRYLMLGSANWNNWAFNKNNEANILIEDQALYQIYLEKFNGILANSSPEYPFDAPEMHPDQADKERIDLITIAGTVAYTRPGKRNKTMDVVLTDSTEINVHRDITQSMKFIEKDCFERLLGEKVRIRTTLKRFRDDLSLTATDVFGPNMKARFTQAALSPEEEEKLNLSLDYEKTRLYADRIVPVNNDEYFEPVHDLIENAKQRVWIAMMDSRIYDKKPYYARKTDRNDPPSLTNSLCDDLVAALDRGVDVIFVYDKFTSPLNSEKKHFLKPLLKAGAKLYQDPEEYTTHSKMLVIDDEISVVGSTNWSYAAVEENNESTVYIVSKEINAAYADYVQRVTKNCSRITNPSHFE